MINGHPTTRKEAEAKRYNKGGIPYNPDLCAHDVRYAGSLKMYFQCSRKPGHGPAKLYCKQHARMVKP